LWFTAGRRSRGSRKKITKRSQPLVGRLSGPAHRTQPIHFETLSRHSELWFPSKAGLPLRRAQSEQQGKARQHAGITHRPDIRNPKSDRTAKAESAKQSQSHFWTPMLPKAASNRNPQSI